jgi:sulfotransferase family protein
MLAAGEEIAIPPESHFLGYLYHRYRGRLRAWTPELTLEAVADAVGDAHFREWELPPELVWAEVEATPPASYADAMDCVYRAYAKREGKRRWGDKTPHYVFELDVLERLFPGMRVVHLIRDGRDVACSHLALHRSGQHWTAGSAPAAAGWWRAALRAGRAAGRQLGERYLEVRYEQLVADPEGTLPEVCAFAGIGYRPEMIEDRRAIVMPGDPLFARAAGAVETQARSWQRELTPRQVAEFEAVAAPELEALGYPLSDIERSSLVEAEARIRAAAFMSFRRCRRWTRQQAHRFAVPLARRKQRRRIRRMEAGGEAGL